MSAESPLTLDYREEDGITIATIFGSSMLDGLSVSRFGEQALEYVGERPGVNLLLNFEKLTYLSSTALTELIRINDSVVSGGGHLRVCGVSDDVHRVFSITNFDKLFEAKKGEGAEHAVARFKRHLELEEEEEAWERRHET